MAEDERTEEQLFNDSMNAKLAEAQGIVEEPEPETPPEEGETAPESTPDEPETPEEVVETPAEPEKLYAGKYKTIEDLEAAVAHQEEMIQRQSNEVGEGRQAKAQLDLLQEQLQRAQAQPDQQAPTVVQNLIDQGRYQEAAQYTQQASPYLYGEVMEQWAAERPFEAFSYHSYQQNQQMLQQLQGQMDPQIKQTQEYVQQQELAQARDSVASAHEDFVDVVGSLDENRLTEIIQNGFPEQVLQGLNGNLQAKVAVFETLYRWEKSDKAGTLGEAAAQAVQKSQQESRTAKEQAAVASATTGSSQEAPAKSEEDQIREQLGAEWKEIPERTSLEGAWTGRETRGTPR